MPGAPPPMQFSPLSFASAPQSPFSQLGSLGKNLAGAAGVLNPQNPLTPGSAVPGAAGPTSVGGPQGPTPLVPPGTTAPAPPNPIQSLMQSLSPPQLLSWLQNASRTGQPLSAGLPGSAAMGGAGMLPGQ